MSSDSSPAGVLSGQLALVTGASRGIGRAIAMRLATAGARVIGTATSEAGAVAISKALSPLGGEGRVLDVRDPAAIDALVKELETVSVLVNNAGVTRDQLVLRMKDEDWQQVLETDLTSVFRCSRSVLRGMRSRDGSTRTSARCRRWTSGPSRPSARWGGPRQLLPGAGERSCRVEQGVGDNPGVSAWSGGAWESRLRNPSSRWTNYHLHHAGLHMVALRGCIAKDISDLLYDPGDLGRSEH